MVTLAGDLLTARAALRELGGVVGRTSFYLALQRGELPATRVGRRWLLSRAALRRHFGMDPGVASTGPGGAAGATPALPIDDRLIR